MGKSEGEKRGTEEREKRERELKIQNSKFKIKKTEIRIQNEVVFPQIVDLN
ncbi:MAG: hypothetical protein KDC90_10315 [Ignavibacteriae bacterium]|nr:hypothetical protein [Ignavibacteriota bacterium]